MPGIQPDIAGSFLRGAQGMQDLRRGRQLERARDYDLAAADDEFNARRSDMEYGGWNPDELGDLQTNPDPWFQRLGQWWKQRRAGRVMPSNMSPEQTMTQQDETAALGFGGPARTFAMPESGPITEEPMYKDGGRVRAIPRYADGGGVGEPEMNRRRRQAEFRREGIDPRTSQTGRGGAIPREGVVRRTTNALRGRGVSAAGRARAVRGGAIAGAAAIVPQLDENYDRTLEQRFGFAEPTADEGEASLGGFAKYAGRRLLGYASDLGNVMSFGAAGNLYRDQQGAIPAEGQEPHKDASGKTPPPETPPTPDETIAQAAITDGARMAQEATAASKPPGAIDFSKVDFEPGEMPNMSVPDWVGFRQQAIKSLTARGVPINQAYEQAMKSVSQMQQQNFVDYATQAHAHLMAGDSRAAALAMRAAYQYFPNGSDVEFRVSRGQDGRPVIAGFGKNEQTGEPVGNPMILSAETLPKFIENFSQPGAWSTWMKDIRAEELDRRKYEEVERPEAESNAVYRDRTGRAALRNAEANVIDAERQRAGQGRRQVDLDRANEVFREAAFDMVSDEDPGLADRVSALMSRIYARKPNLQDNEVVDFVKEAHRRGDLERVMAAAGIGE
jgi:hypothetical protein